MQQRRGRRGGAARLAVLVTAVAASLCAPGATAADAPPLPSDFVGMFAAQGQVVVTTTEKRIATMDAMQAAGVKLIREPIDWKVVERERDVYDFSYYDAMMTEAARHGLRVLPILETTPEFRSSRPKGDTHHWMFPPKDNAEMGHWAAAVAQRYGRGGTFWTNHPSLPYVPIQSWEVWNEPNIPHFWGGLHTSASEYTALLRTVGNAIRAVQPQAEIVTAGLAFSHLGPWATDFLAQMYKAGAKGTFDVVACHPYAKDANDVIAKLASMRDVMRANNDPAQIWNAEWGWATGGEGDSNVITDEAHQASRIGGVIRKLTAYRAVLGIRGFIYFYWQETPINPHRGDESQFHWMGLLRENGARKPSYSVFVDAVKAIPSGTVVPADSSKPALQPPLYDLKSDRKRFNPTADGDVVTDPGSGGAAESFRVRLVTRARFAIQRKKGGKWQEVQHLTRDVNAGGNTVRLTGRALGKPLKAGFYRLRIKAQGVLGKGSDPLTANFRIG